MIVFAHFGQLVGVVFWFALAAYALSVSQAFSYAQWVSGPLADGIARFADTWPYVSLGVLAVYIVLALLGARPKTTGQGVALGLVAAAWAAITATPFLLPALHPLRAGPAADGAVLIALIPIAFLAVVDLVYAEPISDSPPEARHSSDFFACVGAALAVTLMTLSYVAVRDLNLLTATPAAVVTTALWQLLVFIAIFLLLTTVRSVGDLVQSRRVEVAGAALLLIAALTVILRSGLLPLVMQPGWWIDVIAGATAVVAVFALVARGLRVTWTEHDAVERVLGGLAPRLMTASAVMLVLWLVVIGALATQVGALAVSLLVLAAWFRFVRMAGAGEPAVFFVLSLATLGVYFGWLTLNR